jgi:hypothetical protein
VIIKLPGNTIIILSYLPNLLFSCLKEIYKDNFARRIFHKQHIGSSERLSNGFDTYNKFKHIYTAEKYAEDVAELLASHSANSSSSSSSSSSSGVHDESLYD